MYTLYVNRAQEGMKSGLCVRREERRLQVQYDCFEILWCKVVLDDLKGLTDTESGRA